MFAVQLLRGEPDGLEPEARQEVQGKIYTEPIMNTIKILNKLIASPLKKSSFILFLIYTKCKIKKQRHKIFLIHFAIWGKLGSCHLHDFVKTYL